MAPGDTHHFPFGPPGSLPPAPRVSRQWGARILAGAGRRLLPALLVGAFGVAQYTLWSTGAARPRRAPNAALGPLCLLAGGSGNAWLGYLMLAALAPCILAFPVLPGRWTALLAALAVAVWVVLGWCVAWDPVP